MAQRPQCAAPNYKARRKWEYLRPYLVNDFLDTTPRAQYVNGWIDKLDLTKIKVCSSEDTGKGIKRDATFWEEIFVKHISNDIFRISKELFR